MIAEAKIVLFYNPICYFNVFEKYNESSQIKV